ncbi:MAG TPA: DUF3782 domain-containing protein [Spirochaetota bacterium]|nr:DUF3782 domain-containing protein [Spirochaetota bacterium]HPI22425.1 DUF3782 domain-containing protein [Spirochaetota bacterium]HPU88753.1 DUF3782 domain-containing protein [Spirochaetota bacterium]
MNKTTRTSITITPAVRKKIVEIIDERIRDVHVTREDFSELKSIVQDLATAQKRTESRIEELASAQQRTESRIEELASAQQRTESRIEELASAQQRTESRIEELASSQTRTESRLEELAIAQKRTEHTIERGFKDLRDSISALGSRWGIMAEDTFRNAITGLLEGTGYSVSRGTYGDREVDIVVKNGEHLLFEITSSMKKSDIARYVRSADDYQDRTGISPRIMVAAIYIPPTVMREIADAPRTIEIFSIEE